MLIQLPVKETKQLNYRESKVHVGHTESLEGYTGNSWKATLGIPGRLLHVKDTAVQSVAERYGQAGNQTDFTPNAFSA